jgi:hypothetical protein
MGREDFLEVEAETGKKLIAGSHNLGGLGSKPPWSFCSLGREWQSSLPLLEMQREEAHRAARLLVD